MIGLGFLVLPFIAEEAFFIEGLEALTTDEVGAGLVEDEVAARESAAGESAAETQVYSIGKFDDTGGLNAWRYKRLNIPNWTPESNDAWIQQIIDQRASVKYFEPSDASMLRDPVSGEETTLGRELDQLKAASYHQEGGLLVPP